VRDHRRPPPADDIIAKCYASDEFHEGVAAFLEGRAPKWRNG
jgi:enoyl-CoA hydratase/carnithine racemase